MRRLSSMVRNVIDRIRSFIAINSAYLLVGVAALAVQVAAAEFDAFDRFYEYTRAHEEWELDELAMLFVSGTVGFAIMLVIYSRQLRGEIAGRRQAERHASELARFDALTGLANRRFFGEELERRVAEAQASGQALTALLIDLDRFKPVNDTFGHAAGDMLLRQVAERIKECCRSDDLTARLGGDEFVVVARHDRSCFVAEETLGARILAALSQSFRLGDVDVEISASIGQASLASGLGAAQLIERADQAMYRAKRDGRNRCAHFDAELSERMLRRSALETEMRRGVRCGEFEPFFQPLYDVDDARICGFEILARWRHPERGLLSPVEFIPIAEEIGLIGDLGWSILRQACRAAKDWDPALTLAFNLSPLQFKERDLAWKVGAVLAETGFQSARLEIEVTESAVIFDQEAAKATFEALKAIGVRVALDDFGAGHSSVTTLHQLPFDRVKIDRSFVTNGLDDAKNVKIVPAVLSLAHSLGLVTTAEGVESQRDLEWLRGLGCEQAQGFLFGRPMPAEEARGLLDAGRDPVEAPKADAASGF